MFETLGQFKILDRIGAGGMGEVYRARDMRLGRTVAVKVLAPDVAHDPGRRDRFLREARAAAALSHPNIAALYEIGEDQGHLFLAFEFVPGEPLNRVIAGRPLNARRAIDFAVQVADALAEAHAAGIVHRDIKPANIIVTPKDKAKVLDFGLATWTTGGHERDQAAHDATVMATGVGTVLGTAAYMSPEQALGERVDERTDIFSLGIVLFEMLTGRLPFAGPTPTATTLKIVQTPAPALADLNRSVPEELEPIVTKALTKSLDQRYQSAATLAAELRSVAAILDVRSDAAAPIATAPAPARLPRAAVALFGLLGLAAGGALALLAFGAPTPLRSAIGRAWRHSLGPAPPPVIAVLPFDTDPAQTFFADGLADDLITRLGQTSGLKVVGRSATRNHRGRAPRDVARELGAGVVLTGSVHPSNDAVKVSLALIDPVDDTDLWTAQYTRDMKDIFAVQAQVADEVAHALRLTLRPTPSSARAAARVVDPRAYELYLRGRQASAERKLPEAVALFEQAIAADAGLGEACAGIAEALHLQTVFSGAVDASHRDRLLTAAKRAYEIDPDLPQANVAMGLGTDTLADALRYFRRAIELDASYAEAYHRIGDAIHDFDPDRAVAFFRRSLDLDPRQDVLHRDIAGAQAQLGRDDEVQRELDALAPTAGSGSIAAGLRAEFDLRQARYAQAIRTLSSMPDVRASPRFWGALAAALRLGGRADDALAESSAMLVKFPRDCEARSMVAALRVERHDTAAARRPAEPVVARANETSARPSDVRCGLHAAAALQDGVQAARILDRLSASEPRLRAFAEVVSGQAGTDWIDVHVYPWSLIARQPAVAEARERLDAAYTRERDVARAALAGLP
jgi:TolB-like protein